MGGRPPQLEPFRVAVPDADLEDLRGRLRATRWPGDPGNDDWRYGTNERALAELCRSWAEDFDWRAQEAAINELPQHRVVLDDVRSTSSTCGAGGCVAARRRSRSS